MGLGLKYLCVCFDEVLSYAPRNERGRQDDSLFNPDCIKEYPTIRTLSGGVGYNLRGTKITTMPTKNASPLFCKPTGINEMVHSEFVDSINGTIAFKSLNLKAELPAIHKWVNMDYALEYWQMNGHYSQLFAIYQCMEHNPYSHSFTGFFNGILVCQFDVYSVFADELRAHIELEDNDCGFHLLMSPNNVPISGLTTAIVNSFLNYYFSFPAAKRMYAEPDINNQKSIELLERCGFKKLKTVEMSYKRADVYVRTPSAP